MKKLFLIMFSTILCASSPFNTPKPNSFDTSVFNTKRTSENEKAIKNEKVKCRVVCDKKVYSEQKIADAILFYKNSRVYK